MFGIPAGGSGGPAKKKKIKKKGRFVVHVKSILKIDVSLRVRRIFDILKKLLISNLALFLIVTNWK